MKRKTFFASGSLGRVSKLGFGLEKVFYSPLQRFPRFAFLVMILLIAFSVIFRFATNPPAVPPKVSLTQGPASANLSGLPQTASALAQVMELQAVLAEISTQDTLSAVDSIKIERLLSRISLLQKQIQKP